MLLCIDFCSLFIKCFFFYSKIIKLKFKMAPKIFSAIVNGIKSELTSDEVRSTIYRMVADGTITDHWTPSCVALLRALHVIEKRKLRPSQAHGFTTKQIQMISYRIRYAIGRRNRANEMHNLESVGSSSSNHGGTQPQPQELVNGADTVQRIIDFITGTATIQERQQIFQRCYDYQDSTVYESVSMQKNQSQANDTAPFLKMIDNHLQTFKNSAERRKFEDTIKIAIFDVKMENFK